MADDAETQSPVTTPVSEPATQPAPEPQAEGQVTVDEAEHDSRVDEFFKTRDANLQPLHKPQQATQQSPSTPQPAQAAPTAPAAQVQQQPGSLADADRDLCKRWQMTDQDLSALSSLPAETQQRLLGSLRDRTQYVDRIANEFNTLKTQQPGQQAQPGQAQPATAGQQPPAFVSPDDAWKPLAEEYGAETFVQPFRRSVEATVQAAINGLLQQLQPVLQNRQQQQPAGDPALSQYIEEQQIRQAMADLTLPDGVEMNDQVRQQIEGEAYKILEGKFNLLNNNWSHAIPAAAARLFNVQAINAERSRRSQAATNARRGSAETGTRTASARLNPPDPDAELDEQVDAVLKRHNIPH